MVFLVGGFFVFNTSTVFADSALVLTVPPSATITQSTLVPETSGIPTGGNDTVNTAINGLTPISIRLQNTGDTSSASVRISPVGASSHIQLWAKDTSNNWYDINVTGWIDTTGISVPAGYDASTNVYLISDQINSYTLTANLVNAVGGAIVTSSTGTVTVNAPVIAPTITTTNVPTDITTETKATESINGIVTGFSTANRTPISVGLVKGSADYSQVRVVVAGLSDGVQLIATDGTNYYNIIKTGWGPANGFTLANATTPVYLVANTPGTYTATINLVDVSNNNAVLATTTASVIANDPAPVVIAPTLSLSDVPATVTTETAIPETSGVIGASFDTTKGTLIQATLTKGSADYSKVRVVVTGLNSGVQLIALDTTGIWYNIAETGWGPLAGFNLATVTTPVYLVANTPGTYNTTIQLVDVSNNNTVLASTTASVTVNPPTPAANLVLTTPATATITQSTLLAETSGVANSNSAVTTAVAGLTPIAVRLQNTGDATSVKALIAPISAGSHIQLWAKDTSNNWYDINVIGWIAPPGMAFLASYDETTNVYAISDLAGSYPLTVNLVNASTPSTIIATASGTVTVNAPAPIPMVINSSLPTFTAGVESAFTVGTVANDDVGKMVLAHFTIPTGASVTYEAPNGNYYPLTNVYGPETGFPVSDLTSNFKAMFASAGTYTVTVDFRLLDGTLVATKDITTTVIAAPVPMTISTDLPSTVKIGVVTPFTVSTVANDDVGKMVLAHFTIPAGVSVEYLEQDAKWYPLTNVYGPTTTGFPVGNRTSNFRATFSTTGLQTVTVDFQTLTGVSVASKEITTTASAFPTLTLVNPMGGEKYKGGDLVTISWTSTDSEEFDSTNPVSIGFTTEDPSIQTNWQTLTSSQLASGSFQWTVPVLNTTSAKIELMASDLFGNHYYPASGTFSIDSTAPVITVDPYTMSPTNQEIMVTATTNEGTLNFASHTFTANDSFDFVAADEAGNVTTQTVTITNIDKVAPVITVATYNLDSTNADVIVNASTNEGTLNVDSHTFTENGAFDFVATDVAGNVTTQTVTVSNIDKVAPVITIAPYLTTPTNQDITVTATTDKGTLNADSHSFAQNDSFDFVATDTAGNVTTQTVTISNIDKTAPVITLNDITSDIEAGGSYVELGATSVDAVDCSSLSGTGGGGGAGGCSGVVGPAIPSGTVDTNVVGTYLITYNATDVAGNVATPVTRTVNVVIPVATQTVIDQITALPTPITLTNKDAVSSARTAYDALTEIQKSLVSNYSTLTTDEAQIATLQQLADAKVTAHTALTTALATYTSTNYTEANWTTLNGFKTAGDTAIDAATTTDAVTLAQTTATTGMDGVVKLTATQTTPDPTTGAVTSNSTTPEVVLTNPTQPVIVTIEGTTVAKIDVSSFTGNDGSGDIPKITINSSVAEVEIPAGTVTSADTSWDGKIAAPTVTTVTLPVVSGSTTTPGTAIEIGFTGAKLSFDNAVRILIPNQADKKIGYTRDGGVTFTEITNACVSDNQAAVDADLVGTKEDCKMNASNGLDLVIWTKHFTTFATYTQTVNPVSHGGGGGGGGYYVAPVTGQVLGASTGPTVIPGCIGTTGFSTTTGQSCATNSTTTSTVISGCDTRTTGFSTTTGQSCIGNTGVAGQVLGAEHFNFTQLMKNGSKGNEVMELQNFLNSAGYSVGTADGKFGAKTKAALIKFQTANKLKGDGVVGPKVRALLNA